MASPLALSRMKTVIFRPQNLFMLKLSTWDKVDFHVAVDHERYFQQISVGKHFWAELWGWNILLRRCRRMLRGIENNFSEELPVIMSLIRGEVSFEEEFILLFNDLKQRMKIIAYIFRLLSLEAWILIGFTLQRSTFNLLLLLVLRHLYNVIDVYVTFVIWFDINSKDYFYFNKSSQVSNFRECWKLSCLIKAISRQNIFFALSEEINF